MPELLMQVGEDVWSINPTKKDIFLQDYPEAVEVQKPQQQLQPEVDITSAEGMQNLTYYTPDGQAHRIKGAQKDLFLQAFPDAMTIEEVQEKQAEYKKALAEQQAREKERKDLIAAANKEVEDIVNWDDFEWNQEINGLTWDKNKGAYYDKEGNKIDVSASMDGLPPGIQPGSDEAARYKNRLNHATQLAVDEADRIENSLGELLVPEVVDRKGSLTTGLAGWFNDREVIDVDYYEEGDSSPWNIFGVGTGNKLANKNFHPETGVLTTQGKEILAAQMGIDPDTGEPYTIDSIPVEKIEEVQNDFATLNAIQTKVNDDLVTRWEISEIDSSLVENIQGKRAGRPRITNTIASLTGQINELEGITLDEATGDLKIEEEIASEEDKEIAIDYKEKLDKQKVMLSNTELNKEDYSEEEWKNIERLLELEEGEGRKIEGTDEWEDGIGIQGLIGSYYEDLKKRGVLDYEDWTGGTRQTKTRGKDQATKAGLQHDDKGVLVENAVTRNPNFLEANAAFMEENSEELNRLAQLYNTTPEELFKQIQKGRVKVKNFLQKNYDTVDKAFQEDLKSKGYARNSWNNMYKKATEFQSGEKVLGEEVGDFKATGAAKDQAQTLLGSYANFAHLSDEQKNTKINDSMETMLFADPVVKNQYSRIIKDSIAPLEKYRNELITNPDYDPKNDDDVIEVNKLLMDKQRELTIERLYDSPEFKKRLAGIGLAVSEVAEDYQFQFGRENSKFLSAMDAIRGLDGEGGWLPFNDSIADLFEGVGSGVEGIKVSIADKAKGSWHGNQFRRAERKQKELDSLLKQGFNPDDKVKIVNGEYVLSDSPDALSIQERLDNYKEDVSYHQAEVVEQIEDMVESEEWLKYFKQANYDDGMSFEDVFLTVGQALPHIGMAAGGTALAAATGGTALAALAPILTYAGTAMMGLQMYGDNYWGAIEQNMADKGLDKESLAKANPELSPTEIDELWKQEAIANLESGEGANMATSAAYAAAQTLLESYGANQMVEGTIDAVKGVKGVRGLAAGSLFKSSWDDVGQWMLRGAIEKGGNALEEFGTEYMQEILGQVSAATQSGRDYDALIDTSSALQAGIGGAITGFALPFAGTVYNQTRTQIRNTAGEVALKFRPGSRFANRFEMADQYFNEQKAALDDEYQDMDKNPKRKAEYYDKLNTLNNVRNANIKLRGQDYLADMNQDQYKNLMDTYIDIQDYDQQIEKARKSKDKALEKNLRAEQGVLIDKAAEIVKAERTTARVASIMKDLGKEKEMIVVEDENALKREAKKRNVALDTDAPTIGFFTNDGKFVVDKKTAAEMKEGNTAAHELLHKVLFNTLYEVDGEGNIKGKNVARGLAAALDTELDRLDINELEDSKFKRKLELYKKNPAAIRAEEKIVLLADAIESGDLKFNENVFTKIGDQIRRFLQAVGLKDIKFNSGRDVYNFLKDYNASIKKGKLNQAQKRMMEEGAEVGTDIRRFQGTEGKLGKVDVAKENKAIQDSYQKTNELLADEDFDIENSFDQKRALKEAGGVIEATTQRLWDPKSLLTRDEFKKTLEKEYLESLSEYDADRDIEGNAGKSISNKFNLRANKVAKDNIGKVEAESLDAAEARDVADTTEQQDFDVKPAKDRGKARKKEYPSSLRSIKENIPDSSKASLIGGVDAETGKTTGAAKSIIQGVGQNANPESVAKSIIASTKDKSVMQQMRKDGGKFGTDKYNKFVDNVVDEGLTKTIPAATIKRRLGRKANVESGLIDYEQTGTTPTKKITAEGKRTDFNKPVYKINKIDNTKLKEYYKAGEKRQQSLYSMLAEGMIVEGLADLKNDKAFMEKLQDALDLKGIDMTADQYMSDLENSLDQRTKEDTSLDIVKANKALKSRKTRVEKILDETWDMTEKQTLAQAKKNLDAIDKRINPDLITPDQTFEQFRNQQVKENQVDRSIFDENRDQARAAFERIKKDTKRTKRIAKANKGVVELWNDRWDDPGFGSTLGSTGYLEEKLFDDKEYPEMAKVRNRTNRMKDMESQIGHIYSDESGIARIEGILDDTIVNWEMNEIGQSIYDWYWDENATNYKVYNALQNRIKQIKELSLWDLEGLQSELKKANENLPKNIKKILDLRKDIGDPEGDVKATKLLYENKEDVELAIEEKIKKLPKEMIIDSGINVYTGKPMAKKSQTTPAKANKAISFDKLIGKKTKGPTQEIANIVDNLYNKYGKDKDKTFSQLSPNEKVELQTEMMTKLVELGVPISDLVSSRNLNNPGLRLSKINEATPFLRWVSSIGALDNAIKKSQNKIKEARRELKKAKKTSKRNELKRIIKKEQENIADFKASKAAAQAGKIGLRTELKTTIKEALAKKKLTEKENKALKAIENLINRAVRADKPSRNKDIAQKNVDDNVADIKAIQEGIKEFFDIAMKLPKRLQAPFLNMFFAKSTYTNNMGRQISGVLGKMANYPPGYKIINEHVLQFGVYTRLLGMMMNNPEFKVGEAKYKGIKDWLSKNMFQVALADLPNRDNQEGKDGKQGKAYPEGTKGVFDGFPKEKWNPKSEMLPFLRDKIQDYLNDDITLEDLNKISSLTRYFNEYFYLNPNNIEIYNSKNGKVESVSKVYNTEVPNNVVVKGKTYTAKELMAVDPETGLAVFPNVEKAQAYATMKRVRGEWSAKKAQNYLKTEIPLALDKDIANVNVAEYAPTIIPVNKTKKRNSVPKTSKQVKNTLNNSLETTVKANKALKETKGISVFDLDGTLANTKEKVIVTMPDGSIKKLDALQFAEQADILTEQGAEFDFSEFTDVKGAKKGPLADLALKRQNKFGSGDIYVLTARPQASAQNIKLFLDSIGLNVPLENITGLEDGSPQAKADWVLAKTAEGYNDFYFADDSKMNVKAVKQILSQVDVKSKVQIAKANKAVKLDKEFNQQIQEVTGKEAWKKYSDVRGRLEGKRKDAGLFKRFLKQFTITPSAEDFLGLMYDLIGKGERGNRHTKWIKDNLIDPYNKAEQQLLSAKVAVANDFAALKKKFPTLRSTIKGNPLMQEIGVGPYTRSQAVRVYNWVKQGVEIPGLSKRDQNALIKAVEADQELKSFAEELGLINKTKEYPAPEKNWLAGDIKTDLLRGIDTTLRNQLMTEFNENADIIFSKENKNKLRALYGNKWVEALEDSLRRMKSGTNRPVYQGGGARMVNEMLDWLNASVGSVMFLNQKSGLLQLLSTVNFINWGDNNVYAAAKAFMSKDYWPTVMKLLNSDYLVNRRDGLKINVNEAELADAGRKGGIKGAINYLLDKGFVITRIMDSLAIATGGATFYINRVKSLLNRINPETGKKYTKAEAETKAFDDFYEISEESQQSSNPAKISQQQASMAGRVLLAFQNVTMQYNRMTKKAIRDLYNRRKKPGMTQRESDLSNISKIVYYTTVQNLIFNALQQALFAVAFDDEGEEKEKNRTADILHGMADSLLFGLGFGGAIISTVKNVTRVVLTEKEKKSPDYEEAVWEIFNVSPVLDSKVRKLRTTAKTFSWNMKDIKKRGWSLDNPSYLAISQMISAVTNIPLDRVMRKMMNMRQAMDEETKTWQRIALMLGYSGWSLGLPYWGLESTIKREAEQEEKIEKQYKIDTKRLKNQGYKRIPLTGKKSWADGIPKDMKLNRDYIQVERPTGTIEYWLIPKNKKK